MSAFLLLLIWCVSPFADAGEVDVIDEALWARFAGDNGDRWWLQPKVAEDGRGFSQLENARYIVEAFRAAELPDSIALAAVVNSLMESSLLSDHVNPTSRATGLFQCWRSTRVSANLPSGGAGNGTPGFDWGSGEGRDATWDQLKSRERNTARIIYEIRHVRNTTGKTFFGVPAGETFGDHLLDRASQGATVAELAAIWGQHIERYRPSPNGSYAFRGRVAEQLLGDLVHQDTSGWRTNARRETCDPTPWGSASGVFWGAGWPLAPIFPFLDGGWTEGCRAGSYGVRPPRS